MTLASTLARAEEPRVLLVRLDNIGDVVLLSPAVTALREALPDAHLTLLTTKAGAQAAPLLEGVADVVVMRPVWQEIQDIHPDPQDDLRMVLELSRRGFAAALTFTSFSQTPHPAAVLCSLAGIPFRAGSSYERAPEVLMVNVPPPPIAEHQAERNLLLLEGLGFEVRDRSLSLQLPQGCSLRPEGDYLVVSPWASCSARSYSSQKMLDAAGLLAAKRGWPVYVVGREAEAPAAARLAAPARTTVADLVGRTDVADMAALIDGARLVLCNNTLAMHLADATRTPAVVTYAGTDLESQWAPRSTPHRLLRRPTSCSPCYLLDCPYGHECLDLPFHEVARAGEELLVEMGASGEGS